MKKSTKKIVYWILAIILFYVFSSARVSIGTIEVAHEVKQDIGEKFPVIVEKKMNVTKYKVEQVPYGNPVCSLSAYNFTSKYTYEEEVIDGKRVATCSFFVTNLEDMAGNFSFHSQQFISGVLHDGSDQTKLIQALGNATFRWNFTLDLSNSAYCALQSSGVPNRMKCFYLEPTTYQIKQIPYVVEETKNVTEYHSNTQQTIVVKENITGQIYTNRFFGYRQFFYLGY